MRAVAILAALGAVLAVAGARTGDRGGEPRPPALPAPVSRTAVEPDPAADDPPPVPCCLPQPAPQELDAAADFWESVRVCLEAAAESTADAHRESILAATARHLSLDDAQRRSFEAVARHVLVELEQAWQTRDIAWAASAEEPPGVQERYESDKRAALARMEAVLPRTPAGEDLRTRLEEWVDALR